MSAGEILSAPLRHGGEAVYRLGWALDGASGAVREVGDSITDAGFWLWRRVEGLREDPACECEGRQHVGSGREGCRDGWELHLRDDDEGEADDD